MSTAKNIVPFDRGGSRGHRELAFLPAALEVVETPPSPMGRAIGATILVLFAVALGWAWLGSVDIIATATGKIVPSGRSKVIQPFEIGVVRAIHVDNGQRVKIGDVLIELDPTINGAERERAHNDLIAAELDVARLRAAVAGGADPLADFHPPEGANTTLGLAQRQYLMTQMAAQQAKLAAVDRQLTQKEAERDTSRATIGKIEALLPILEQQLDIRKVLFEHETGSRLIYLQTLQNFVEQQQERLVQQSHLHEAEAAVGALTATRTQTEEEYRRGLLDELTKAEAKAAGLAQDLVKAGERARLQQLTAPIDGVVQQLAVHTVGGVVTPAQPLLVIVPSDTHLEIQAMVSNRDIGFVRAGQQADIKIDTFPYTRYGLIHGEVESVSADAVSPDDRGDGSNRKAEPAAKGTDQTNQEPMYEARVSLDRARMQIDDNMVNFTPGMAVTVEIKTGSRRILSYLLSPLMRYGHESLHER